MKRIRKIARPIICMARLLNTFLVQRAKAVTVVDTISARYFFSAVMWALPADNGKKQQPVSFENGPLFCYLQYLHAVI